MDMLTKIVILLFCSQQVASDASTLDIQKPKSTPAGLSNAKTPTVQDLNIINDPALKAANLDDLLASLVSQSNVKSVNDMDLSTLLKNMEDPTHSGGSNTNEVTNSNSQQNTGDDDSNRIATSEAASTSNTASPFRISNRQSPGGRTNSFLAGQALDNFGSNAPSMSGNNFGFSSDDSSFPSQMSAFPTPIMQSTNNNQLPDFHNLPMNNGGSNSGNDDDSSAFSINFFAGQQNMRQGSNIPLQGSANTNFNQEWDNIMNPRRRNDDDDSTSNNINFGQRQQQQRNRNFMFNSRGNFGSTDNSFMFSTQTGNTNDDSSSFLTGFQSDDDSSSPFDNSLSSSFTSNGIGRLNIPNSWQSNDDMDASGSLNRNFFTRRSSNTQTNAPFGFNNFQFNNNNDDNDDGGNRQFPSFRNNAFNFRPQQFRQLNTNWNNFDDDDSIFSSGRFRQRNAINNNFWRSSSFMSNDDNDDNSRFGNFRRPRTPIFRNRMWRSFDDDGDDGSFFRPRMFGTRSVFFPPRNSFFRHRFPRRHGIFRRRLIFRRPMHSMRPMRLF